MEANPILRWGGVVGNLLDGGHLGLVDDDGKQDWSIMMVKKKNSKKNKIFGPQPKMVNC